MKPMKSGMPMMGAPGAGMPTAPTAAPEAPTENVTCPVCGSSVAKSDIDGKSLPVSLDENGALCLGGEGEAPETPMPEMPATAPSSPDETDLIGKNL